MATANSGTTKSRTVRAPCVRAHERRYAICRKQRHFAVRFSGLEYLHKQTAPEVFNVDVF